MGGLTAAHVGVLLFCLSQRDLWGVDPTSTELNQEIDGTVPNISGNLSGAGNIALFDKAANDNGDNLFTPKVYNCDNVVSLWSVPHTYPDIDYTGKESIVLKTDVQTGLEIKLNPSSARNTDSVEFNDVEFNAGKKNPRYVDGAGVRPESVGVIFWKRTA